MSSIHSEKDKCSGSMIKETFRWTHFIQKLMPWLEGKKTDAKRPLETARKDMMLMYVGMNRPIHMLCLAMRQSSLGEGSFEVKCRAALE